jgi:hypothetical protein
MSDLQTLLVSVLAERYSANAARIRELAAPLTEAQFWQKPYPYGNSFGHLVLHLTGNLNYYIGAQIANTGYVRDRPREFSDAAPPSKNETIAQFDRAVEMVLQTIKAQSPEDWCAKYQGVRTDSDTRLSIILNCASHMQHHIGQMIYIGYAAERTSESGTRRQD